MAGEILLIILVTNSPDMKGKYCTDSVYFLHPVYMYLFLRGKKKVRKYGTDDIKVKREQSRIVSDAFRGYIEQEVNGAFPPCNAPYWANKHRFRMPSFARKSLKRN